MSLYPVSANGTSKIFRPPPRETKMRHDNGLDFVNGFTVLGHLTQSNPELANIAAFF